MEWILGKSNICTMFLNRKWRKEKTKISNDSMGPDIGYVPNEQTLHFFVFTNLMVNLFSFFSSITLHHFIPFICVYFLFDFGHLELETMPRWLEKAVLTLWNWLNRIQFQPPFFISFFNPSIMFHFRYQKDSMRTRINLVSRRTQNLNWFQFCSSNRQIALRFEIRNEMHVFKWTTIGPI